MKKIFKPQQEIERNKELATELKELNPFAYNFVKNAKFSNIERLNALLEKLVFLSRDIKGSLDLLANNPKAYSKALEKYAKVLDGFTNYLDRSIQQQETVDNNL